MAKSSSTGRWWPLFGTDPRRRPRALTILLLPLIAALIATPAWADSAGGSFRLWPHSARELAMGDAGTLLAPGLESLFSQPASLVGLDGWELGASLQRPMGGVELGLSSLVIGTGTGHRFASQRERSPSSRHAAALAFQHLGATLADGSGWGEWTLAAAGAWSPWRWLSTGLRADYSRGGSEDDLDRGRALALGFGLRAVIFHPGVELGWTVEDLVHRFYWEEDSEDTRRRASAQTLALAAHLPLELRAEIQARYRHRSLERFNLGLEWSPWRERLQLRLGLIAHRRVETSLSPSFGAGLALGALLVDYGFRYERVEGPGSQHRLALRWRGSRS
jgi:hypothetical protein